MKSRIPSDIRFVVAFIALSLSAVGSARDVPVEYRAVVDSAIRGGAAIYVHDAAASRATDELARRKILKRDKRLRGWLTDLAPGEAGIDVTFVGEEDGAFVAIHRVRVPFGDGA